MKAKKPLLLAVLILALLVVALMLPATASGAHVTKVNFHALSADWPEPMDPPLWVTPGGTVHFRDWLYHGLYFVPDPDPAYADQDPEVLKPLTGWVEDYVSMNQGNVHNKGTVWVGAMSEDAVFGDEPTYTGAYSTETDRLFHAHADQPFHFMPINSERSDALGLPS
jgi:hypothetical protein